MVMLSNKSKRTKQDWNNRPRNKYSLRPFGSLCFRFHGNACPQRNALAHVYKRSFGRGKKVDFGRESQAQSQPSHLILLTFSGKLLHSSRLLFPHWKRRKQKSKQANTKRCDNWVKIGAEEHTEMSGLQGESGERMASISSILKWLK